MRVRKLSHYTLTAKLAAHVHEVTMWSSVVISIKINDVVNHIHLDGNLGSDNVGGVKIVQRSNCSTLILWLE